MKNTHAKVTAMAGLSRADTGRRTEWVERRWPELGGRGYVLTLNGKTKHVREAQREALPCKWSLACMLSKVRDAKGCGQPGKVPKGRPKRGRT